MDSGTRHHSLSTPSPFTSTTAWNHPLPSLNRDASPPSPSNVSTQPTPTPTPAAAAVMSASSSLPRPSLFDLSLPSKLEIDQVYWNGLHTLHRFEIKNITPDPIRIKLKSNMESQIAFQLTNENLIEMENEAFHPNLHSSSTSNPPSSFHLEPSKHTTSPHQDISFSNCLSPDPSVSSTHLHTLSATQTTASSITSTTSISSDSKPFLPSYHTHSTPSILSSHTGPDLYPPFQSFSNPNLSSSSSSSLPSPSKFLSPSSSSESKENHLPLNDPHLLQHNTTHPTSIHTSTFPPPPPPPLPTDEALHDPLPYISTTNTASAAALGAYASSPIGYEFNQLFNYVNHIDELQLDPLEARQLILAFLPPSPPASSSLENEENAYDFQEVSGTLLFYGYKLCNKSLPLPPSTKPDCHVPVKFKARICRSVLWTDVSHHLVFEECLVQTTSIREFTIWNKSEIDLYFVLNTADVPNSLTFTDYNTGEPLDTTKRISAYSHCGVRVTFKPTQVGDFFYEVLLENVNDASNVEVIRIHCVVRSALNEASFILVGENQLDFGDVCAGQCHTSKLVLKNVSENALDVHLSAEGAKVLFDVMHPNHHRKNDEDDILYEQQPFDTSPSPFKSNELIHNESLQPISRPSTPVADTTSSLLLPNNDHPLTSLTRSPYYPIQMSSGNHPMRSISLDSSVHDLVRSSSVVQSNSHSSLLVGGPTGTNDPETDDFPDSDSASSSSSSARFPIAWGSPGVAHTPPRPTYPANSLLESQNSRGPHYIDEVLLKPGLERTVFLTYYPEKSVQEDYNAGCLMKKTFRILLQHGKERKVIQCKARICTSFITVSPSILSFGETDVGTLKSLPIKITNISEIQACVQLSFASKVLSCPTHEIPIPPKQSVHVKLDIFPRKINPDYRKEITVVNLLNRDNNQIVEVRSTNLDTQRITWHSLFYRIMTPSSTNYLDFGSVVGHFFALRTFTIQNVSNKALVLNITSSTEHIALYKRKKSVPVGELQNTSIASTTSTATAVLPSTAPVHGHHAFTTATTSFQPVPSSTTPILPIPNATPTTTPSATTTTTTTTMTTTTTTTTTTTPVTTSTPPVTKEKKQVFETMADRKTIKRTNSDLIPNSVTSDYLDLALPKKQQPIKTVHTSGYELLADSMDEVIRVLQNLNIADVNTFQPPPMEQKFVKWIMMLKESLNSCIEHQDLVPIHTDVHVPAEKEVELVAVLRAPMIHERRKKLDGRLIFSLLEYDADLLPKVQGHLPVREFLTRCVLCPCIMEVAQRNINFGTLELQAEIRKAILIRNKSDVPLLFAIKKSGSIASGDISIEHPLGVIPPHGSKEVNFVFQPSMSGVYFEKLTVENVQNPENVQTVCLKANLRKSHTFNIHTEALDFGKCLVNELSTTKFITLQNTDTKQPHLFTVRVQEEDNALQFEFQVLSSEVMQETTEDVEDKIESLEQKLKIAKRKGHLEKINKIHETIVELRRASELVVSAFQEDPTVSNTNLNVPTSTASSSSTSWSSANTTASSSTTSSSSASSSSPPTTVATAVAAVSSSSAANNSTITSSTPASAATTYSFSTSGTDKKMDLLTLLVEPNTLKKIAVQVRPKPILSPPAPLASSISPATSVLASSSDLTSYSCHGFICIHRHKNTDILKKVAYSCLVCHDQASFTASSLEEISCSSSSSSTTTTTTTSSSSTSSSLTGSCQDVSTQTSSLNAHVNVALSKPSLSTVEGSTSTASAVVAAAAPLAATSSSTSSSSTPTPTATPVSDNTLVLETESVDLGKFVLDHETPFYIVVINKHPTLTKSYFIQDPCVAPREREGLVLPNERKVINAIFLPTKSGKQSHRIQIRSVQDPLLLLNFTLNYVGVYKDALILKKDSQIIQDIDLGYCYNAKRYTTRATLLLQSTVHELVKISAISTLAQQAAVFLDEACTLSLTDTFLDSNQTLPVYLAIQPNLIPIALGAGPIKKGTSPCLSRQLVGGFKFTGTNSSGDEVCSHNIRFQAIIGHSLFHATPTYLNLGYLDVLRPLQVSFTVSNLSDKMPLHVKFTSTSPDMITIHEASAYLVGYDEEQTSQEASSKTTVQLTIAPRDVGYYSEQIFITNLNSTETSATIHMSLFVDPHRLNLNLSQCTKFSSSWDCPDAQPFVLLEWDNVYFYITPENSIMQTDHPCHPQESISLTNTTDTAMVLFAKSDSGIQVKVSSHPAIESNSAKGQPNNPVLTSLTRCSPYILLNPGDTMHCQITAPSPSSYFSEEALLTLSQGKKIKTRGILTFCDASLEQVLKVVELQAFYCISMGEVVQSKPIHLKAKKGEVVNFMLPIKNISSCPLHLNLVSPPFIRLQKSIVPPTSPPSSPFAPTTSPSFPEPHVIPSSQTADLLFTLDTADLPGGAHEWTLMLKNTHNPCNVMPIPITANVSCLELMISGRDLDDTNVLCLPPVWIPNLKADHSCDAWFNLTNPSSSEVRFTVSINLIQPIADLIQLLVLSRFSNSPLNWLTLPANGSIEVKVKVVVLEQSKLTKSFPKWMLDDRGVQLGKVFVENEDGNLTIPVRGKILEQVSFELDVPVLEVSLDTTCELHITNLSSKHALKLAARPELFHELDSIQLDLPSYVHLDPSQVVAVPLRLEKSEFLESGDLMVIRFEDTESLCNATQSVKLRLKEAKEVESISTSAKVRNPLLPSPLFLEKCTDDILVIKGCTKKDKMYELDVGQQDVGPNLSRKISVELHQPLACRFSLKTIPSDTSDWLTFSKTEGLLDPLHQKSQPIILTFYPSVRNTFFAYLIVENMDYPSDPKFIKVSMEVVGRLNSKKQRPFSLICNGLGDSPTIRYEDVYYGNEYITRSFRIVNRESIALEFSLQVQGLAPHDETQVLFSSCTSSPVLFKEISVPPESSSQVFVRFYPAPGALDLNPELQETKHFEIQVHSRLIRDYLQTANVVATCWFPRIQLSTTTLMFMSGSVHSNHSNQDPTLSSSSSIASSSSFSSSSTAASLPISVLPSTINSPSLLATHSSHSLHQKDQNPELVKELRISNLHLSRYVPIVIMNDSLFFEVSVAQEEHILDELDGTPPLPITTTHPQHTSTFSPLPTLKTLEQELQPGQHLLVRVRVNVEAVSSYFERIKREKYIQEYFTVYHHRYPTEHFFVKMKLSFGHLNEFSLLRWNTWQSSKFISLENRICQFLKLLHCPYDVSLPFHFHILVDQLVYYATTASVPIDHFYLLSSLLWTSLKNTTLTSTSHPLEVQKYWRYFLSFFTQSHPILDDLQKLYTPTNS